jgi:phospholipid transport system substrate-binding protein
MQLSINFKRFILVLVLVCSGLVFAAPETTTEEPAEAQPAAQQAAVQDPIAMLKGVTNNVLRALKQYHISKSSSPKQLDVVIDEYVLPYVDFNEMSTWVAGRKAWANASEASRKEFIKQFQILVIRTYATALNSYSDETIEFVPQKIDTSKKRVQVSSYIKRPNKENIRLDYRLIKNGNSWLVYDMIIEGVSILQGFQAQFSDKIRQKGLDPVIQEIKEHNNKPLKKSKDA